MSWQDVPEIEITMLEWVVSHIALVRHDRGSSKPGWFLGTHFLWIDIRWCISHTPFKTCLAPSVTAISSRGLYYYVAANRNVSPRPHTLMMTLPISVHASKSGGKQRTIVFGMMRLYINQAWKVMPAQSRVNGFVGRGVKTISIMKAIHIDARVKSHSNDRRSNFTSFDLVPERVAVELTLYHTNEQLRTNHG